MELPVLLSPEEVAAVLKVSPRTVRGWLRNPDHPLKGNKIDGTMWRITQEQFKEYLERR